MSMMMVQVDVMCCKSVGTDLSMLDIDDLMTEICQLKKEVKLLETKLRERDQLNRKDVCGVSLSDQTSPDLLLSVCDEEQKTSVKLLDCEMELKTQIKEEQTDEDHVIYSDPMKVKEERSERNQNKIKEESHFVTGEESLSCLMPEKTSAAENSQKTAYMDSVTCSQCGKIFTRKSDLHRHIRIHTGERPYTCERCGNAFVRKCHLKRHMGIHTGEKPHKFSTLGRSRFSQVLAFGMIQHRKEQITSTTDVEDTLLDCEMELRTDMKRNRQMKLIGFIHSDPMEVKEGSSEPNEIEEKHHHLITKGESLSCLKTENFSAEKSPRVDDSLTCRQCGKIFSLKYSHHVHMKIHTGEQPYKCDACGKTFIHRSPEKSGVMRVERALCGQGV